MVMDNPFTEPVTPFIEKEAKEIQHLLEAIEITKEHINRASDPIKIAVFIEQLNKKEEEYQSKVKDLRSVMDHDRLAH